MNEAASASWTYAAAEAASAVNEYDDARQWVRDKTVPVTTPLAVEVWVFNEALDRTLLVRHRWRGWVPPGGAVEPGEHPRVTAVRETFEETGVVLSQLGSPAAVAVRSFRADWSSTLALSYCAVCREVEVVGEAGQPVAWMALSNGWESCFPEDVERLGAHAQRIRMSRE